MGKGNRVKNEKAVGVLTAEANKKAAQSRSMPTWVGTLIVVVVLVALIAVALISILNSRGVFRRMHVVAESENYKVTAPMMSYVVYSEYQNLVATYNSYYQYISGGNSANINIQIPAGTGGDPLDTSVSLREQYYSRPTDAAPETATQTWFDHFVELAQKDVQQVLSFCEQSRTLGLTLTDADRAEIDKAVTTIEGYADQYDNVSASAYIKAVYGEGVTAKDIRKMMELTQLAQKYDDYKKEQFYIAAADGVTAEYEANRSTYDVYTDYVGYTFTASFLPDGENDADLWATYHARQEVLAARVTALAAAESEEDFTALLRGYLIEDALAEGHTDEEAAAEADDELLNAKKIAHEKGSSAFDDWAYNADRAVGDTDKVETAPQGRTELPPDDPDADPAPDPIYEYEEAESSYSAYYLLKLPYADTGDVVRDVAHLLFSNSTYVGLSVTDSLPAAKKALADRVLAKGKTVSPLTMAEELLEGWKADGKLVEKDGVYTMDKDLFITLATELTDDSSVLYEKVTKGQMVDTFEDWMFDPARVANEVSDPAVSTTYGYHVMLYVGNERNAFTHKVQQSLADEAYDEWIETAKDEREVTFNTKAFKYIG